MRKKVGLIMFLMSAILVSVVVYALYPSSVSVPSSGVVVSPNLTVWKDLNCTQNLTSILWGTLTPNQTTTYPCYIRNVGTGNARLSLTSSNYLPINASLFLVLSWNREGTIVVPGAVVQAILTLKVAWNITDITTFSFNIVINGY